MKRKPILSSPQSVILRCVRFFLPPVGLCEESLLLRHPCSKRSFAKFILERSEGLRMTTCLMPKRVDVPMREYAPDIPHTADQIIAED